jgi:hypothetical protein
VLLSKNAEDRYQSGFDWNQISNIVSNFLKKKETSRNFEIFNDKVLQNFKSRKNFMAAKKKLTSAQAFEEVIDGKGK